MLIEEKGSTDNKGSTDKLKLFSAHMLCCELLNQALPIVMLVNMNTAVEQSGVTVSRWYRHNSHSNSTYPLINGH